MYFRWNTWEPEKHILDKLLIADFNNRTRKNQKSKTLVRKSVNKRPAPTKTRVNNTLRTRRLRSSTSSDISTTAIVSPTTNDEDSVEKTKIDDDQTEVFKPRSNEKDLPISPKQSDHEEEEEEEDKAMDIEKPQLDESLKEFLWQPEKSSTTTTTITEVTDQSGTTVFIRELSDLSTSNINKTTRFLGYGNGGRGGRH